jgi:hypothetical protein
VAVACGIVVVGSVFVVIAAWDMLAGLHTLDTRHDLQQALNDAGLRGRGLTISDMTLLVRVITMVAAGCATAIAVLSVETMRRSRGARLAMTVLAVPLFLGGLVLGGIFSTAVVAAVATLWFGPARDWFEGTPRARVDRPVTAEHPRPTTTVPPPPHQTWSAPSRPGWAPPPTSTYDVRRHAGSARPNALLTACLLTWMFCTMTVLLVSASLVVLAVDSQTVLDRMHEQDPQLAERGISDHGLLVIGYVTGSVVIVWAASAAVLAVAVFRGRRWAWYALLVSTSAVVVLSLLAVLGFVLVLVPLVAAITTIALLVRPEVKNWLLSR